MKNTILITLCLLVVGLAIVGVSMKESPTKAVPAPQEDNSAPVKTAGVDVVENTNLETAPEFSVTAVSGAEYSLASSLAEGKPTVLYFMSSTCSTCAKNWPVMSELIPQYEDQVNFVAVSVDPSDDVETIKALAQEKGFTFDATAGSPDVALAFGVKKQTAKFAIDKEGNIVERHDGALDAAGWEALILKALGEDAKPVAAEVKTASADVVEKSTLDPAPEFSVTAVSGTEYSLESSVEEGKPTVLYFMASWCSKCAQNWNAMNEVLPQYADQVNVVAVSIDPTDDAKTIKDLAEDKGFTFDATTGNPELAIKYGVDKQTAKFAIDKEGNIVERHDGVMSAEEWEAFVKQLL